MALYLYDAGACFVFILGWVELESYILVYLSFFFFCCCCRGALSALLLKRYCVGLEGGAENTAAVWHVAGRQPRAARAEREPGGSGDFQTEWRVPLQILALRSL